MCDEMTYEERVKYCNRYMKYNKDLSETITKLGIERFGNTLSALSRQWRKELPQLHEIDKPARFVVFPMLIELSNLLEEMTDTVERDSSIETDAFKNIFMKTYELYIEVSNNEFNSSQYE